MFSVGLSTMPWVMLPAQIASILAAYLERRRSMRHNRGRLPKKSNSGR